MPAPSRTPTRAALRFARAAALALLAVTYPTHAEPAPAATPAPAVSDLTIHRRAATVTLSLANGIALAVRPMPASDEVRCTIILAGGELTETPATRGLSRAVAAAWLIPTASDSAAAPDSPDADITIARNLAPEGFQLSLWAKPQHVPEMLARAARMIREPRIDPAGFAEWQAVVRTLDSRPPPPPKQMGLAISELLAPRDDPRSAEPTPARLAAITSDDTLAWLTLRASADPISISIVGNIKPDQAVAAVSQAFGTLAPRPRVAPDTLAALRTAPDPPPGPLLINLPLDGSWPGSPNYVLIAYRVPAFSALPALRGLLTAIDPLETHLRDRFATTPPPPVAQASTTPLSPIRVEHIAVSLVPSRAYFSLGLLLVQFRLPPDTDPLDLPRFVREATDAIESFARTGLDEAATRTARESVAALTKSRLDSTSYWASLLPVLPLHNLTPDDLAAATDDYAALTPARINADLRKYLQPAQRIELIARPTTP
jgi:predicted Zn-dependent peptidase